MQELLEQFTGSNLKAKREASLLTQDELAEKVGVTKYAIWTWENKKKQPSIKHLRALRKFFEAKK